jgi:transposase
MTAMTETETIMSRPTEITATPEEKAELDLLARCGHRGESSRAKAILQTLAGSTAQDIATWERVSVSAVKKWRSAYLKHGIDGIRRKPRPGRPGHRGAAAMGIVLASVDGQPTRAWTSTRLAAACRDQGVTLSPSHLSRLMRARRLRFRRPRHTLKGRQDAGEVERAGLRLSLLKQQAQAGDRIVLHVDESEALTHPYLARTWAPQGIDLRVEAPGQSRKVAMFGALDIATREMIVMTTRTKRSRDFLTFLDLLRERHPRTPVTVVADNGPIHRSKLTRDALALRPWITVEWMPKYAPELNEIERSWRDLKQHFLANRTYADLADLDAAIHSSVNNMNSRRQQAFSVTYLQKAA